MFSENFNFLLSTILLVLILVTLHYSFLAVTFSRLFSSMLLALIVLLLNLLRFQLVCCLRDLFIELLLLPLLFFVRFNCILNVFFFIFSWIFGYLLCYLSSLNLFRSWWILRFGFRRFLIRYFIFKFEALSLRGQWCHCAQQSQDYDLVDFHFCNYYYLIILTIL